MASVKQRAVNNFCGSNNPHRASALQRGARRALHLCKAGLAPLQISILRAKAGLKPVLAFQTGLNIVVQTTLRHLCEMTKQPTRMDTNHSFSAISANACNLVQRDCSTRSRSIAVASDILGGAVASQPNRKMFGCISPYLRLDGCINPAGLHLPGLFSLAPFRSPRKESGLAQDRSKRTPRTQPVSCSVRSHARSKASHTSTTHIRPVIPHACELPPAAGVLSMT